MPGMWPGCYPASRRVTRVVPGFAPGNRADRGITPCQTPVGPLSHLCQTVRSLIQIPLFMRTDPIAILIISSDITIAYMGRIGTCV